MAVVLRCGDVKEPPMTLNIGLAITLTIALPVATAAQTQRSPLLEEPRLLQRAMSLVEGFGSDENGAPADGFYAELGHMITGSGWISAGPGYRRHVSRRRALFDVSAALSWRAYKIGQGRLEFPHL